MAEMSRDWHHWEGNDLVLKLRVLPRSSRDELAGPQEDAYRVRITAPPVDGKANAHLIAFLAQTFGVSKRAVILLSGESSRIKRVRIARPGRQPIPELASAPDSN